MVKVKNKKRNLSENVNNKKETKNKKVLNPFEVHINKEKMKVLGRKLKNDRGLPGVSRAKALKKRSHTLLQEYKIQNKSNKFMDKRIGERNTGMTEDDRVLARFTALRAKAHKKSIFNLADDEVLTHRGQTLSEIEKFDDPRSDDEESIDDGNQSGKLESSFVEDAHFGGGILKKTGVDGAKSHKDLIDQLIAESKKRKVEKQKLKEQTLQLTEKLDTEWKDLLPLVSKSKKTGDEVDLQTKADDYDKVMRELKFEARGTPSDRLKTEDEIAKEDKDKLEKLEQERLDRMKGFIEDKTSNSKHRSADDLDENFEFNLDPEVMLTYNKEGESNVEVCADINGKAVGENEENSENENEDNDEHTEEKGESGGDVDSDEYETESEDNLSDLKGESSASDSEELEVNNFAERNTEVLLDTSNTQGWEKLSVKDNLKRKPFEERENANKKQKNNDNVNECTTKELIKADLLKRKDMMEKARTELPYTFNLPESYESLQKTLEGKSSEEESVIIERMIKCNHPSLAESNKEKLGMLFVYLLQHINDISFELIEKVSYNRCFNTFYSLVPQMFDLAQLNKENAQNCIIEVIKEKQMEYRKRCRSYPGIEVLLYLKLVSCLFPTSDFRHPVVTPSLVFIDQMLNQCKVRTKRDIAYGLFLTTLLLEYTTLSKRYLPSSTKFLSGILHLAIPKTGIRLIKVLPPFKASSNSLVLCNNYSEETLNVKLGVADLFNEEIDCEFKIRSLYVTLSLIREFVNNFSELPSNFEIFKDAVSYVEMIPMSNYPEIVRNEFQTVKSILQELESSRKLEYIVMEKKRPKALRLYEPNIVKVYDGKKHKVQSKEKAERDKLLHKLKIERKGAIREIRRDKAFLGRLKINQQIQSDLERKQKVRQLLADASIQQSELNQMDRKKKRK